MKRDSLFVLSAIFALSLSSASHAQSGSLSNPTAKVFRSCDLTSRQGLVTISTKYQVVLEFPAQIEELSANRGEIMKISPDKPELIKNRLYIDAVKTSGVSDLVVIVDGDALLFRLVAENTSFNGVRKYSVQPCNTAPRLEHHDLEQHPEHQPLEHPAQPRLAHPQPRGDHRSDRDHDHLQPHQQRQERRVRRAQLARVVGQTRRAIHPHDARREGQWLEFDCFSSLAERRRYPDRRQGTRGTRPALGGARRLEQPRLRARARRSPPRHDADEHADNARDPPGVVMPRVWRLLALGAILAVGSASAGPTIGLPKIPILDPLLRLTGLELPTGVTLPDVPGLPDLSGVKLPEIPKTVTLPQVSTTVPVPGQDTRDAPDYAFTKNVHSLPDYRLEKLTEAKLPFLETVNLERLKTYEANRDACRKAELAGKPYPNASDCPQHEHALPISMLEDSQESARALRKAWQRFEDRYYWRAMTELNNPAYYIAFCYISWGGGPNPARPDVRVSVPRANLPQQFDAKVAYPEPDPQFYLDDYIPLPKVPKEDYCDELNLEFLPFMYVPGFCISLFGEKIICTEDLGLTDPNAPRAERTPFGSTTTKPCGACCGPSSGRTARIWRSTNKTPSTPCCLETTTNSCS
ncbi:MAG: hypothetical protein HC933_04490 [Pleurocapsa sp. SU_196_0]|nr:hypothetical protein [Pleurocapsa sp. SU_196_0]